MVFERYPMAILILSDKELVTDGTWRKFRCFLENGVRHFGTRCKAIRCVNRLKDLRSGV